MTTPLQESVRKFFVDDDWNFDEKSGIFQAGVNIKNKLGSYRLVVDAEEERFLLCYGILATHADEDRRAAVAEYLARANWGLKIGNFEVDMRDGEVRYKASMTNEEGQAPSKETIQRLIYTIHGMLDQYGDGLLAVIFGFDTPEEAIRKAESDLAPS